MPAIDHFWAVVRPAAGTGWPLSRSSPKFLHDLTGTASLLQETVAGCARRRPVLVVTGRHRERWSRSWSTSRPGAGRRALAPRLHGGDTARPSARPGPMRARAAVIATFAASLARDRADPAVGRRSATSTSATAARPRGAFVVDEFVEKPSSRRGRATSAAGTTAGTPGCSSSGPGRCSTCWRLAPRLRGVAARPRRATDRLDGALAHPARIALDHAVAEPAAERRVASCRVVRLGRHRRLRLAADVLASRRRRGARRRDLVRAVGSGLVVPQRPAGGAGRPRRRRGRRHPGRAAGHHPARAGGQGDRDRLGAGRAT